MGRDAGIQPDGQGIALENLIEPLPEKRRTDIAPSLDRPKQHPIPILAMSGGVKVAAQGNLAFGMDGDGVGFPAFDGQFQHPVFPVLPEIPHLERSRLRATPARIKVDVEDRTIPQPLQRVGIRCIKHGADLLRCEGRGFAAPQPCMAGLGALDPGNRIHRAELFIGQEPIKRRQRGQPVGDGGLGCPGASQMLPIGDHMPLRDAIQVVRAGYTHDGDKISHRAPIARPRVRGGEIGQPNTLDRHSGENFEGAGQIVPGGCNKLVHTPMIPRSLCYA